MWCVRAFKDGCFSNVASFDTIEAATEFLQSCLGDGEEMFRKGNVLSNYDSAYIVSAEYFIDVFACGNSGAD